MITDYCIIRVITIRFYQLLLFDLQSDSLFKFSVSNEPYMLALVYKLYIELTISDYGLLHHT